MYVGSRNWNTGNDLAWNWPWKDESNLFCKPSEGPIFHGGTNIVLLVVPHSLHTASSDRVTREG